jgi:hypothetical protein
MTFLDANPRRRYAALTAAAKLAAVASLEASSEGPPAIGGLMAQQSATAFLDHSGRGRGRGRRSMRGEGVI